MTPHHLHALAAAYSLHDARQRLTELAAAEARRNVDGLLDAAPILRSCSAWGVRHGVGGHGDPVGGLLTAERGPVRVTTWADRVARLDGKLTWIADQIPGPAMTDPSWDPMQRITLALPFLQPGTAAAITRHLVDEDRWVREATGVGPVRAPLIGVPCPGCGRRELYVQVTGPEDAWTVVCATGCRCRGVNDGDNPQQDPGCPCGMPGAVEGVAHIWPRDVVLGAVAGGA